LLYCFETIDKSESTRSHLECLLPCLHLDSEEHREEVVVIIFNVDEREERPEGRGLGVGGGLKEVYVVSQGVQEGLQDHLVLEPGGEGFQEEGLDGKLEVGVRGKLQTGVQKD
jgi:hypothetical protein